MKNIKYSFRLLDGDENIEKCLVKLDGQKRSNYIRVALRFYISYGDKLKSIDDNLRLLLQIAEHGQLIQDKPQQGAEEVIEKPEEPHEEPLSEAEKMLKDSIQNLLDI